MAHATAGEPEAALPDGIGGWNWGALLLNVIWAVRHRVWFGLLTLVPGVGVAVPFILGARGSEWAWRKGGWGSVARFRAVQRRWAIAGLIVPVVLIGLAAPGIIVATQAALRGSEPCRMALARLQQNPLALEALGAPVSPGRFVAGSIEVGTASGKAELDIPVAGTRRGGTLHVEARRGPGPWTLERVLLELDNGGRLDLGGDGPPGGSASPPDSSRA
jgi:hypothetical protein